MTSIQYMLDFEVIRKKMQNHYEKHHGKTVKRELIISLIPNDHSKIGTIFFSLNGSPPKGYAIYKSGAIYFYDNEGQRYNKFYLDYIRNSEKLIEELKKLDFKKSTHFIWNGEVIKEFGEIFAGLC